MSSTLRTKENIFKTQFLAFDHINLEIMKHYLSYLFSYNLENVCQLNLTWTCLFLPKWTWMEFIMHRLCSVLSVFLSISFSFPVALWHAVHLQDIWLSALSLNILSILINSRHLFSLCMCAVKFCFTCTNCIVLQIENRDYLIISFF